MANLYGLDAGGNPAYVKAAGAGSNGDPFIISHDLISPELKSAFVSASGNADVVTAVGGSKLRVMAMTITALSGCTVKLQSTGVASTDKTPPFHLGDNGNLTQANDLGLFDSLASEKLNAVVSGSTVYTVMLSYREVLT
jgi:hypothetical protein